MATPLSIEVRGRSFMVRLPPLDLRQDILVAYGENATEKRWRNLRRIFAAAVVLCVPEVAIGVKASGTAAARESLMDFGGEVYSTLVTDKSWTDADFITAGGSLIKIISESGVWPTEPEVKAAVGNSGGEGG